MGVARNVIVQATCHGADNSAMVDAVRAAGGRARGIATVRPDIDESELLALDAAGVRGVRFNFVRRLVDASPEDDLQTIAKKVAPLGWHVVLYFESADLPELEGFFGSLPVPLVVDHMGRPDVTQPVEGPQFTRFLRFVEDNDVWVKVTCPERLSVTGPAALSGERHAYTDVVPFARRVVEEFPDRVLWGTDWPHPNLTDHAGRRSPRRPRPAGDGHRRPAPQAPRRQPDAPVLARRGLLTPQLPSQLPDFDKVRSCNTPTR